MSFTTGSKHQRLQQHSDEVHTNHLSHTRPHQTNSDNTTPSPPKTLALKKSIQPPAIPSPPTFSDEENIKNGGELDSRYECAICIHWLDEPVLTSCGHRFCKSCINSWLHNHNQCCPLDNKKLSSEHDIFPDRFTQREIEQIRWKCPNSPQGCSVQASPIEIDKHLSMCPYRSQNNKCPFASIKCEFISNPNTITMEAHLKDDIAHHMSLILNAFQNSYTANWNPQKEMTTAANTNGHFLPPPPPQYANEDEENLIKAMCQRIVVLEQRCREQGVEITNLTKQISNNHQIDPRYSNGVIVWEIGNFSTLVEQMRVNANNQVYSRECYTSPYGYKFCARIKVQPKNDHLLSLHVHLMQSENDYHLEWPFKGRIKLCMVHPRDTQLSQHDTIMTKPEILAFHQPCERISARGFGFIEYANIADIMMKGFCGDNDVLVIKIQINIV